MRLIFFALFAVSVALGTALKGQNAEEILLAKKTLAALQPQSFSKQKEYCGYIGYNAKGELIATQALGGDTASCNPILPRDFAPVASYHTHGGFDPEYISEIPSDIDLDGDHLERINGYVSTPGGRFWFVDSVNLEVRQLCGAACLPVAPNFEKGADGYIALRYSRQELLRKLNEY